MSIAEKLTTIAENEQKVYDAGFKAGQAQGGGSAEDNPFYYASSLNGCFGGAVFPENYDLVLRQKQQGSAVGAYTYIFNNCGKLKTAKLICEEQTGKAMSFESSFAKANDSANPSTLETVDLTEFFRAFTNLRIAFQQQTKLKSIYGALDLSSCTNTTNTFNQCKSLEDVRFEEGTIGIAMAFNHCTKLSAESYHSIIKGCSKTAAFTLTLPPETTVRSVYDATYGSGAWDTITAEYSNLTIAYT